MPDKMHAVEIRVKVPLPQLRYLMYDGEVLPKRRRVILEQAFCRELLDL